MKSAVDEIRMSNDKYYNHIKRMETHCDLVWKYLEKFTKTDLATHLKFTIFEAKQLIAEHDKDKFPGHPLCSRYVDISWLYSCKANGVDCDVVYDKGHDNATIQHITTNKHHPEYWDPNYKPVEVTNFDLRDSVKLNSVDGESMPVISIIEMCSDWEATGEERGNKGSEWATKCRTNNRYMFSEEKWVLIMKILEEMEKAGC